ncbi:allantoinase AllB [Hahella sp. KA22]|uniref:allantoinase AllB n=1 Tax=Hahella sp. KA22 TaxID=1628392 RepID=UPI000FDF194F|nr:allantoinase AllB [Hahella sp. KA22]AZZ94312.1 allantoinase AllB [Hahella sp. KA22]QAY57686.1 allantoinase AllB [Hahella sp. KA22]
MSGVAIRSRRVITDQGMQPATVLMAGGKIVEVQPYDMSIDADYKLVDVGNDVVMPGLVDTHVHINEPGRTEWEGFNTATQAAAAGGITTLVDMPLNCIPVTTTADAFRTKLDAVSDKLWVDCGFWGGVVPQNIDDLPALLDAGVLGVKSFLIDSGIDEFPPVTESDVKRAMPILARYNVPYLIHAELDKEHSPAPTIGASYQSFLASRPKAWENDAIDLMIGAARDFKAQGVDCKVHIVHLSSAEALAAIAAAKEEGLSFTVETCPHYLTLFAEAIPDGKTLFKCCPPIRENDNREHLWQALEQRLIDFVVSDHSPCTPQLKEIDSGDIEKAWGGISALQFSLPLVWHEAHQRGLSLPFISRLMSWETARFAGLAHRKGRLAPGYDADVLVFDDHQAVTISKDMIKHRHKITPYEGMQATGAIRQTWLRGQCIYKDDQFIGAAKGQPLLRESKAG